MLQVALILILILGALIAVRLGYLARRRQAIGASLFTGLMLSVAIYALGYGLELISSSLENMLRFARLEYLGFAQIPAFWLALSLRYANQTAWMKPRRLLLLWSVPLIVLFASWTNDLHHLFFVSVSRAPGSPFQGLVFIGGPIYWLHLFYGALSFILSCLILSRQFLSPHVIYRRQVTLMLGASLSVVMVTALHLSGLTPLPNVNLIPFAMILASILLGWGILYFRLIDLTPVARDVLFARLMDGVLVLDDQGRLVDFNPAAGRVMGLLDQSIGLKLIDLVPEQVRPAIARLEAGETDLEATLGRPGDLIFEIRQTTLNLESSQLAGRLIVLHDATQRVRTQMALEALNTELEKRVELRTLEQIETIERLEGEIGGRLVAEEKLQSLQDGLLGRLTEQSRKLNAIYEVLLNWDNAAGAEDVLAQSLERIARIMNAQAVCFHERGADGSLSRTADWGLSLEDARQIEHLPGEWLDENLSLISIDLARDKRLPLALHLPGYTGYLAGPMELRDGAFGLLQLFYRQARSITVDDIVFLSLIAEQLGIILENARLRQVIEHRAAQLERQRLARDLHDSVTQSLHSLALQADVLRFRLAKGWTERAMQTLDQLDDSARLALKEMRLLLYEMRLTPLEEIHLLEALRVRLEAVEGRAGIQWTLDAPELPGWSQAWEPDLYAIAMEALNNSLKHAGANHVMVQVKGGLNWLQMVIQDDGRGFTPAMGPQAGMGLQSMRERAERLNGQLTIQSEPGQGVLVQLCLGQPEQPESFDPLPGGQDETNPDINR